MNLVSKKTTAKKQKTITKFRPLLLSRHPSHQILREILNYNPFRCIVRLGSTTTKEQAYKGKLTNSQLVNVREINSSQGVANSASKLRMKQCFTQAGVKTANWWSYSGQAWHPNGVSHQATQRSHLSYPIIAKSHYGSRGEGNTKLDNQQQLESWIRGKDLSHYIFEKFYDYSKEYRLHVTNDGCFYTCRKLLKSDTPENEQWHRHDENSVWIVEENPKFMKPNNWLAIVQDCINAKNALGLDICAFDVKVQGSSKQTPEWIIIESCSAPSFGEITTEKYKNELNRLISSKHRV